MKRMSLALALLLLPLSAALSAAHGFVVRAIPADRSTLERPPTRLQYWFSEDLESRFSEIKLRDQSGAVIANGGVDESNAALLTLRVPPELPDGAYIVELRPAFVSDGHVIAESRVFFVGEEVGGVSGQAADDRAIPLEALWRFLLNTANFLFFGCAALYGAVLMPAWGVVQQGQRQVPARVMRRLRVCLIVGIALAVSANLIALLQQSMVFFNAGALQVLEQGLWQVVQIGSRFGDVWTFRMVLLIFAAVLLFAAEYLREILPGLAVGIWKGLAWLGALFVGLTMITSHAAGSLVLPWAAILVNWIHALAVAYWVGGILTFVLVLPVALQPYQGEDRQRALRAVMNRFSRTVTLMIFIVIGTGLYNALNYFSTVEDAGSSYGRSLAVKAVLVLLLILVGARQHLALRPQLVSRLPITPRLRARIIGAGRFLTWLRLEVAIAIIALLSVGWLSATPIPEPESLLSNVESPRATQIVGDYTVSAAILPGGPGVNTYDITVSDAAGPVDDVDIYQRLVHPTRDRRSAWHASETVDSGLFTAAGDDIDQAGDWQSLVDIVDADGDRQRAAFAWQISEQASVQRTRDPNTLHLLALVAVMAAILAWIYRPAKRFLARLNVGLASALMAAAAILVAVGVMAFGAAQLAERQREYERTLYPPPEQVNTVLPDAASLQRGEALYLEYCLAWQNDPAGVQSLRKQLPTVGDDLLFRATRDGWRDLPPCAGELSAEQRWDVVNYFRTLEERD